MEERGRVESERKEGGKEWETIGSKEKVRQRKGKERNWTEWKTEQDRGREDGGAGRYGGKGAK